MELWFMELHLNQLTYKNVFSEEENHILEKQL